MYCCPTLYQDTKDDDLIWDRKLDYFYNVMRGKSIHGIVAADWGPLDTCMGGLNDIGSSEQGGTRAPTRWHLPTLVIAQIIPAVQI